MKFERKKSLKQRAAEAPVKMKLYKKKKKKKIVIKKQTKWDRLKTWLNTELGRF